MSKGEGTHVALNVENDQLVAVLASAAGSRVQVKGWVTAQRPMDVDPNDPAAMGKWIAGELKNASMLRHARRGRSIFVVPRGEVVLKRISFPPGTPESDLPSMVHLQMVRQLTMSPETAAIDFVSIPAGVAGMVAGGVQRAPITVLSGALQGDRLQWRRDVARAAGIKLGRVALKSAGAGALLAELSQRRGGGVMGIAIGCGSTEFVVVEDGQLVFARATDLVRPEGSARHDHETFADKVAVEAKRTWMSYRVAPDSPEIDSVMVLGDDDLAKLVATKCAEGMELPSEAAAFPALIEVPVDMPAKDRAAVAPLVGLVAEPVIGRPTLDFLHPRRAPDLGARRRQRALIGALAAILALGGAYTAMQLDLSKKQQRLDELRGEWSSQNDVYAEYVRGKAKAEHLDRWASNHVDWLSHLRLLNDQLPDPRVAQLDEIAGRSVEEVAYKRPAGRREYSDGDWSSRMQATFTLAGRMKERAIADSLRSSLVDDTRYRLESKGPDLPERFDWRLITTARRPDEAIPKGTTAPVKPAGNTKGGGA